jgi:hypothetical protein
VTIKQVIVSNKENARIKTMEKMKFGWWYVRYAFTYEPMKAFGAWEDECKRQFPQYDTYSTLEMVDVYTDYCYQNLMPKNFLVSTIDAVTCPLFKFRRTFYFFLILKHKISYRIGKLFDKEQIEIIDIDTTDWEE